MLRLAYKGMICVVVAALLSSCAGKSATEALWEATDPTYYVRMDADNVDEETLKKTGLKYYTDSRKIFYYVEKNESRDLQSPDSRRG